MKGIRPFSECGEFLCQRWLANKVHSGKLVRYVGRLGDSTHRPHQEDSRGVCFHCIVSCRLLLSGTFQTLSTLRVASPPPLVSPSGIFSDSRTGMLIPTSTSEAPEPPPLPLVSRHLLLLLLSKSAGPGVLFQLLGTAQPGDGGNRS